MGKSWVMGNNIFINIKFDLVKGVRFIYLFKIRLFSTYCRVSFVIGIRSIRYFKFLFL